MSTVHRQSVARYILRGYEKPASIWPWEHVPTRSEAAHEKFARLLEQPASCWRSDYINRDGQLPVHT
jgi:hypothetical protein